MENGFGGRLKLLRKKSGLTQAQLALMLGKSTSAVRMWELGTNEPDIKTLVKLSSIFDSSLDYLLCRDIVKGSPGAVRTNVEVINISEYSLKLSSDTHIFRRNLLISNHLNGIVSIFQCSANNILTAKAVSLKEY